MHGGGTARSRPRLHALLASAIALALTLVGPSVAALGHNGRQIVVYPQVTTPGTTIDVYGSFLWTEQPLEIVLLAIDGTQWTLGQSETDGNGSFTTVVTLPGSLPDATYGVLVRTPDGDDAHADLVIRNQIPVMAVVFGIAAVTGVVLFVLAVVLRRRRRIDPQV